MLKLRIYTDSIPCIMSPFILMCNISLSERSNLMKINEEHAAQVTARGILGLILFYF